MTYSFKRLRTIHLATIELENDQSYRSEVLLSKAIQVDSFECAKVLIENGADVNGQGNNLLIRAIAFENFETARCLLDHGADPFAGNNGSADYSMELAPYSKKGPLSEEAYLALLEKIKNCRPIERYFPRKEMCPAVKQRTYSINPKTKAESIKVKNILDMAVTFTAMVRLFEKGSKQKIIKRLEKDLQLLVSINGKEDFECLHMLFCKWFEINIVTASKELKNKAVKVSKKASYGHAAKVFDIAVKVYVYYCHLPNCEKVTELLPLLHGAVDTPIMNNLISRYQTAGINSETIESVGESQYLVLQSLVARHIKEEFNDEIYPVQYDDIMWQLLNR